MYACIHAPDAGALARSFSPWVETIDPSTAVFALSPRQLEEWDMLPLNTAVASAIEAAVIAARNLPGRTYIAPGDETRILGELPIDCLPPDPTIFETLDLWGIRTLADLVRLPENGLMARLGRRGVWLQKLARGALERPLKPAIPESTYEESAELDHPLKLREPLVFLIGRFLFDLTKRLKVQSLAAQALKLKLNRQERVLRLPFPTRDVKFLIKLVEHSLETHPPDEPVEKVLLRIEPTEPRRVQHGLFTLAAPEPEKLELTLGKIRGLVGPENVIYPRVLNTYRPGSGAVDAPYLAFRYFRPPLEAQVEEKAIRTKLFRGRILNIAGPWRSSGDWWRQDGWDRDEFDLYLTDGALYRLVRDRAAGQWFAEGTYD
jgi:protein ImuB